MAFAHEQEHRVAALDGDLAALGGAVTTALCGHWEHDGPCRWPHHTASTAAADEVVVLVRFDADHGDEDEVRARVRAALAAGRLVSPDGRTTTWRLVG